MFCNACGSPTPDDAWFCSACGKSLSDVLAAKVCKIIELYKSLGRKPELAKSETLRLKYTAVVYLQLVGWDTESARNLTWDEGSWRDEVSGLNNIQWLIGRVLLDEHMAYPDWDSERWLGQNAEREEMIRRICVQQFGRSWF